MAWTKEELGAWLTELRATAGLTQKAVGSEVDRDYSQIGEYEKGRRDPPGTVLLGMLATLGVTFQPAPSHVRTSSERLDAIEAKLDELLQATRAPDGIPDAPPPPRHPRDAEADRQRVRARPEGLGG